MFATGVGATLSTDSMAVATAVERMIARLPASSGINDLIPEEEAQPVVDAALRDALLKMLASGMLAASTRPIAAVRREGIDRPVATALARSDAAATAPFTASLRHETVPLDIVAHALLPLLDGDHGEEQLIEALLERVEAGTLRFAQAGEPVTDAEAIAACARDHVGRVLKMAGDAGLLIPTDSAGSARSDRATRTPRTRRAA